MGKTVGNQGQKLVWCHVSVLRCCRAAGAEVLVQEVLSAGVPHTADVLQVIWVLRVHGATNPVRFDNAHQHQRTCSTCSTCSTLHPWHLHHLEHLQHQHWSLYHRTLSPHRPVRPCSTS